MTTLKFKVNKASKASKDNNNGVVKLDHRSHILELPDTYIGSVEKTQEPIWCLPEVSEAEKSTSSIIFDKKELSFIPGEYKIFDEIIVNALDQYIRTHEDETCTNKVKNIKVNIDKESGVISVRNDGKGIPIEIHSKEQIYIPELIFGHLLTSTNYNKSAKKHVGGKNGYGAKLANIYSLKFYIETCDGKKKFTQTFYDNMSRKDKPKVVNSKNNPYTLVRYLPDYKRFKLDKLTDDMLSIMNRRVYDMAACATNASIFYNDTKINCDSFDKYINYYIGDKTQTPRVFEKYNRWDIGMALNTTETFEAISFVNGINTSKGGKHVDYIVNQIIKKLIEWVKKKKQIILKPNFIKDHIIIFIKCTIDNPSFTSQTKEYLSTNKEHFGCKCDISDKFITLASKIGIIEKAIEIYEQKFNKTLKKNDGKRMNILKGVPKLEDANWAGTKNGFKCTLILTEGDSAKAMAMSGLPIIGRDQYGVFPLKGKILNVKDVTPQKMLENNEILNIIKIVGLQFGKDYKDTSGLRYGKLLILTDQDEDGSHIKGLLFNLFESIWPSLYYLDGFLNSMLTPIIKVKKLKKEKIFYSVKDYDKWNNTNNTKGWKAKYYKGLGTSTAKEAKEYFKEFRLVNYTTNTKDDKEALHLAFSKDDGSADKRKEWLGDYNKDITLDFSKKSVPIDKFIKEEMVHFSMSDCVRSLPSMVDGLKPSQRKVLYSCFKRNLIGNEIRVAQLAGYVSEHGAYHHGEMSLNGTIINLAQDYVGSNNLNLLNPVGQFGTRVGGGKDAGQPRYVQTKLMPYSNLIFNKKDNSLYKFNHDDDGKPVEPEYYMPIIPMLLVNGSKGIGTGWSTDIPCFNPTDIIGTIKTYLDKGMLNTIHPFYRDFKGKISLKSPNMYECRGVYEIKDSKIIITELPVGVWSDAYKIYLEKITIDPKNTNKMQILRYYKSYCTDIEAKFELFINDDTIWELNKYNEKSKMTNLEKVLKLVTTINMNNMIAFDAENKIKKYNNIQEILLEYIKLRLNVYIKRKEYLLKTLADEIQLLELKVRFINEYIEELIIIHKREEEDIEKQLETREFPRYDDSFDYLLKLPIKSLSKNKMDELKNILVAKKTEYDFIKSKSNKDLWIDDLNDLIKTLPKCYNKNKKLFKINKKK